MEVKQAVCDNCDKQDAECVKLKLLYVFTYTLCQSCVSKAFRSFTKGK